ncbi:transmembrane protein 6/97 [Sporodiniella umbellata]|nr:transmembrane protein 6/97 [Sporodiniella umbellata]
MKAAKTNKETRVDSLRSVDKILLYYFASHIPITLLFDLQAIYPIDWVPQSLIDINNRYISILDDPLMNPAKNSQMFWFKSFVFCEAILQLPFFFVAIYGIYYRKPWIRLPLIIYGTHVATTVIPCISEVLFEASLELFQTIGLLCLYMPYFLVPLIAAVDSILIVHRLY